jgi:hypothetical protein
VATKYALRCTRGKDRAHGWEHIIPRMVQMLRETFERGQLRGVTTYTIEAYAFDTDTLAIGAVVFRHSNVNDKKFCNDLIVALKSVSAMELVITFDVKKQKGRKCRN